MTSETDAALFLARHEHILRSLAHTVRITSGQMHIELDELLALGRIGLFDAFRDLHRKTVNVPETVVAWTAARNAMFDGLRLATDWRRSSDAAQRELSIARCEERFGGPNNAAHAVEDEHNETLGDCLTVMVISVAGHVVSEAYLEPNPEIRSLRAQVAADVIHAVDMLEPPLRAVIHRRFLEQLSTEQTAAALGYSLSHVEALQRRAIRLLRAPLREYASALLYAGGSLSLTHR